MQSKITFKSDGFILSGIAHTPDDLRPGERRPAFLVLHGFGGNKESRGAIVIAEQLADWGYVAMRFDFRGCGESEGEPGRILCLDQVADASNAVTYMSSRPDVDPERIALIGSSFGSSSTSSFASGRDLAMLQEPPG